MHLDRLVRRELERFRILEYCHWRSLSQALNCKVVTEKAALDYLPQALPQTPFRKQVLYLLTHSYESAQLIHGFLADHRTRDVAENA